MLYGFESLWSLRELFGQKDGRVPDKWGSVPSTAHTRGLKRADKEAGEVNGGNSRERRGREAQAHRTWEEEQLGNVTKEIPRSSTEGMSFKMLQFYSPQKIVAKGMNGRSQRVVRIERWTTVCTW